VNWITGYDPKGPRHIFVSYHRADLGGAEMIQSALEFAGLRVWRRCVDVRPGEDWRARIREAISENTLVFLACFSQTSVTSPRSRQNEELNLALDEWRQRRPGVPWIVPVRFDDCELPDLNAGTGQSLSSLRSADLFGAEKHEGLDRLVATVIGILGLNAADAIHSGHY
jgi:TIR domain-containing protein